MLHLLRFKKLKKYSVSGEISIFKLLLFYRSSYKLKNLMMLYLLKCNIIYFCVI